MAPELPPPPYTSLTMTWLVGETAACAGATPTSAAAIVASAASAAAARRGRATPPRTWIGSDGSTGIVAVRMIHPPVSYTHLRAHETRHDLVCRLLLEK